MTNENSLENNLKLKYRYSFHLSVGDKNIDPIFVRSVKLPEVYKSNLPDGEKSTKYSTMVVVFYDTVDCDLFTLFDEEKATATLNYYNKQGTVIDSYYFILKRHMIDFSSLDYGDNNNAHKENARLLFEDKIPHIGSDDKACKVIVNFEVEDMRKNVASRTNE